MYRKIYEFITSGIAVKKGAESKKKKKRLRSTSVTSKTSESVPRNQGTPG